MPRSETLGNLGVLLIAVTASVMLSGCSEEPARTEAPVPSTPPAASATADPGEAVQRYDLKGKVVRVNKAGMELTVAHENIPGFMAAMTMPYTVKDGAQLDNLAPGVEITAKVVSSGASYWLEDVKPAPPK